MAVVPTTTTMSGADGEIRSANNPNPAATISSALRTRSIHDTGCVEVAPKHAHDSTAPDRTTRTNTTVNPMRNASATAAPTHGTANSRIATPKATISLAVERVEAARGLTPYTSTQENAWLVLASRALAKEANNLAITVNGETAKNAVYRNYRSSDVAAKPITITNAGDAPVQAVVSVTGAPITPEPAASNGFKIERNFFTLDGKPAAGMDVTMQLTYFGIRLPAASSGPAGCSRRATPNPTC